PESNGRLVFVSADLGSITHEMQREVVERLQSRFGDLYRLDNVLLSATHTHAGPGGYWHYGTSGPLGSAFYAEHYEVLVHGIVEAIAAAHEDLEPGAVYLNRGQVE